VKYDEVGGKENIKTENGRFTAKEIFADNLPQRGRRLTW